MCILSTIFLFLSILSVDLSSVGQRERREWTAIVPSVLDSRHLESELQERQREYFLLEVQIKERRNKEAADRRNQLESKAVQRSRLYEDEDKVLLDKLELELSGRKKERDTADRQRRVDMQNLEEALILGGLIEAKSGEASKKENNKNDNEDGNGSVGNGDDMTSVSRVPVRTMPPMQYTESALSVPTTGDLSLELDNMTKIAKQANKSHMTVQEMEEIQSSMAQRAMQKDKKLASLVFEGQELFFAKSVLAIQKGKGMLCTYVCVLHYN